MIEKRKKRKHAGEYSTNEDPWKPTKTELEITTYLYRRLPTKDGRLSGLVVRTFSPCDAVDALLESPWAKIQPGEVATKQSKPVLFATQAAAVAFLDNLLRKNMFHRVILVPKKSVTKSREDSKGSKVKSKRLSNGLKREIAADGTTCSENPSGISNLPPTSSVEDKNSEDQSSSSNILRETTASTKSSSSVTSKPVRVEMSKEQMFVIDDPMTMYVWIFEPPPGLFNWLAGSAVLVGIIICCLFPVWPSQLRTGAYYLTLIVSGLFGLLIVLAIIRLCLYVIVWLCSLGKYEFWLFPNYFEDCGFFDSFRPCYSFRPCGEKLGSKKDKGRVKSLTSATTSSGTRNQLANQRLLTDTENPNESLDKLD